MDSKTILLVEDNADDEALTFRALMKNNIGNRLVVARDGAEALDYLFGTGQYSGRDLNFGPVGPEPAKGQRAGSLAPVAGQ
jgi:two-component system response regulator